MSPTTERTLKFTKFDSMLAYQLDFKGIYTAQEFHWAQEKESQLPVKSNFRAPGTFSQTRHNWESKTGIWKDSSIPAEQRFSTYPVGECLLWRDNRSIKSWKFRILEIKLCWNTYLILGKRQHLFFVFVFSLFFFMPVPLCRNGLAIPFLSSPQRLALKLHLFFINMSLETWLHLT